MTHDERFEAKFTREGPDECWPWIGSIQSNGYGRFSYYGKVIGAHVAAVLLAGTEIPPGYEVDHLCFVRHCVNLAHLEVVTGEENRRRSVVRRVEIHGHPTRCPRDHDLTGSNLVVEPGGKRRCLTCRRAGGRAAMQRMRERARRGS